MKPIYIIIGAVFAVMLFRMLTSAPRAPAGDLRSLVKDGAIIVDVRTPGEYRSGHIEGALNIPHNDISQLKANTETDKAVILYCHSGARASSAKRTLEQAGYTQVINGGSLRHMQSALTGR